MKQHTENQTTYINNKPISVCLTEKMQGFQMQYVKDEKKSLGEVPKGKIRLKKRLFSKNW